MTHFHLLLLYKSILYLHACAVNAILNQIQCRIKISSGNKRHHWRVISRICVTATPLIGDLQHLWVYSSSWKKCMRSQMRVIVSFFSHQRKNARDKAGQEDPTTSRTSCGKFTLDGEMGTSPSLPCPQTSSSCPQQNGFHVRLDCQCLVVIPKRFID